MDPHIKRVREQIPLKIAESQPDLTTGVRIGDLSNKDKSRLLFHACRTLIFARNINEGLINQLKMQNCPVDDQ